MRLSPAEQLFRDITTKGITYIDQAIQTRSPETFYLDFKLTEKADYSSQRRLFDSDQKNFSKAISAFGNSEGGIIIWGVQTGGSENDYAISKTPIKGVSNFMSLLNSFSSLLTTPPHPTITNQMISSNTDEGFVVSLIPKSSIRPFQSIYNNEFRYYIRAGSSSLPAPHVFLKSLFGEEPGPDVFIAFGIQEAELQGDTIQLKIGIILHNGGEAVARDLNGYAHVGGKGLGLEINDQLNFDYYKNSINGMKVSFNAKSNYKLGVAQEVQPLVIHVPISSSFEGDIQFRFLVHSHNQASWRYEKNTSNEEIKKAYQMFISNPDRGEATNMLAKTLLPEPPSDEQTL